MAHVYPPAPVGIYPGTVPALNRELDQSRCDRCGAQARVLLAGAAGRLAFCGHHWHRYEAELTKGDWRVLASSMSELTT